MNTEEQKLFDQLTASEQVAPGIGMVIIDPKKLAAYLYKLTQELEKEKEQRLLIADSLQLLYKGLDTPIITENPDGSIEYRGHKYLRYSAGSHIYAGDPPLTVSWIGGDSAEKSGMTIARPDHGDVGRLEP